MWIGIKLFQYMCMCVCVCMFGVGVDSSIQGSLSGDNWLWTYALVTTDFELVLENKDYWA